LPPEVQGESLQLKRVLANLLHNALNYTPAKGQIKIKLEKNDQSVKVSVCDNGPGLPNGDLRKVFHRFYRSDNGRDMVGTGLGLYLSRQIILAHQGQIWVENTCPQGCKFTFTPPFSHYGGAR
jgi:signal transduction histidine kinase